ncbi:hypothetical protein ABPG72_007486 [Tetrahymena utriculariae]
MNNSLRKVTEIKREQTSQQDDALNQENVSHVIAQFQRKGFESLSLEDLAVATIHQDFSQQFKQATGLDWQSKFQVKAIERLNYARFDINWLTRKSDDYFKPLFQNILKGDLQRVQQFVNSCPKDMNVLKCVDSTKKSPVHLAASEGQQSVLEFLVSKGFNVDSRDRTLKTPLHYACLNGFATAADFLLKSGANIMAKDSTGKNPIHFASTCNNPQIISLLVGIKPDIVFSTDNSGLTCLHYAVWNNSIKQVDIIRTLLDSHADVNAQDDDGKTALHHASKGARTRVIPILIQRGTDITLRDRAQKKTCLEMAANDRTRELIVVYSSTPLSHSTAPKEDLAWMNTALRGQKLPIIPKPKEQSPEPPKKILPYNEDFTTIASWIRGRFFKLMKKLQEEGIKNWHHLKKPYVYTGSWMEGIKSLEELYELIKDIPPAEAIIRAFNILCPYEKEMPRVTGDEEAIDNFYGSSWYDGGSYNYSKRLETDKRLSAQSEIDEQINSLKLALQIREKALEDSELQNVEILRKNQELERLLNETKTKLNTLIEDQKKQLLSKESQLKDLNKKVSNLTKQVNDKEMEISELKANQAQINNEELQNLFEENERLTKENERLIKQNEMLTREIAELREQEKQKAAQAAIVIQQQEAFMVQNEQESTSDDDAIIKLYQSLRNNPPPLIQRMQQADIDGDSRLTQTEFMLFLEKLRMSSKEIQSLCRVAGFMDGRKLLEIQDFKDILEERPRMRELWQKYLFRIMFDAFKSKGLQAEQAFNLMDVDNHQMITPSEIRNGLESLKIILNQKDFNNLYTVFDENKNGSISIQEIKEIFLKYENVSLDVDISFSDRLAKDEYESGKALTKPNEAYNSTNNDISQSLIKFTEDVEQIDGDLKVQIPYANNLIGSSNLKQVTIRVMLRGSEDPNIFKSIILFDDKSWNYVVQVPIRSVLRENVNDDLLIQLYSDEEFVETNFLGEVKILWKISLDQPNKWVISQEFPLANVSYKKQITKEVSGKIAVQLKWIPAASKEFKGKLVQKDMLRQEEVQFKRTLVEPGMVEFVIVSAYLQEKKENLKCTIKTPDKKEITYDAKYDAKGYPYWSQKQLVDLQAGPEKLLDSVRVTIYYNEGMIIKDKRIIGEVYVNWEECVNFPGEYLTKKSYLFKQHPHVEKPSKVYVQVRWIPESMYRTLAGFKQGSLKDRKKDIKTSKEDLKEGILKVLLVRAKDLRGDDAIDSSDPYVILKYQNYDKVIEAKSKVKKYTVNPAWYQILQLKISFYKDGIVPPLKVEIWDQDKISDDSLGECVIDVSPSIEAPCTWAVNDYFLVEDPKYKPLPNAPDAKPKIYLQTYFVPEGMNDPNTKPEDKENLMQVREENTICGQLKVKIVHARELRKADRNGSDPYVQINFPGNVEVKTSTISNTLNPQWNEVFVQKILISKDRMAPIKLIIKDSDFLASDDILGYVNVDWSKCAEDPGSWGVNNVFPLEGTADIKAKAETLGFIYVQIKFIEEGMIDDQSYPPLIENLAQLIADRQGLYKGNLRVFLVHCRDIVKADDGKNDFSDAFVVFKVPGGKQVKSNVIKDDQYPTWKQIYDIPIFMPKDSIQPMRVEVIDDDLFGSDLMGYTNVDLLEALNNPQKWAINKIFQLDGDQEMEKKYKTNKFGVIYLQIMFVVDGIKNEDKPLPLIEDMDEIIRKKKEEAKTPMRGTLVVNVVMAQNLKIADSKSSDPYVEVTFPNKKKFSTPYIPENLNPIWNAEFRDRIDIYKESYQPLHFKVLDKDTMAIDDILGELTLDWMDCFENPTMWRINDFKELTGQNKMGQNLGKLYVEAKFLRDSDLETVEGQAQCKTLSELANEYGRIIGNLQVNIISGANLKNTDTIGKSDPYVTVYLSNNSKQPLKTKPIKDELNPVWNFTGVIPINMLRCQLKQAELYLDVYDEDNITDELIGRVCIDVISILEKANQEQFYEDIIQDVKKKEGTNYGTLRSMFKWEPSNDCEDVLGLREPEIIFKGDLFVNIENGRNIKNQALIGKSDPKVNFGFNLFPKLVFESKVFDNNLNPDFKFENLIPLELNLKKARQLRLNLSIRDKQLIGSTALCGVSISLADLIEKPGKWLSEYLDLKDNDGKPGCGHSFVQIQWRQKEPAPAEPLVTQKPAVLDYKEFLKQGEPPRFPGELFINVIGARKLKSSTFDKSDPFTEIKISKGDKKIIKTKVIDDNENPNWNHSDSFKLDLSEEDWDTLKLYVVVYDYDYTINDKLGSLEIHLKDYFYDKERKWYDKIEQLVDEKKFPGAGEIYIQFQWRPEGEQLSNTNPPENQLLKLETEAKKKAEEIAKKKAEVDSEPFVKTKIFFNILSARNLIKADIFDESDPFVKVTFNFCKVNFITPVIDNNPNPVWNFQKEIEVEYQPSKLKEAEVMFTLYDYDITTNDFLGQMIINIDHMIKDPKIWFNEIQQLQDEKCTRGKNGIFYAQMQWRPEGVLSEQDKKLPELLDISKFYKGAEPVGTVVIAAVSAKGILGVEEKGKYSDALFNIKFNKKDAKTKVIQSLNPEWKEVFKFPINFKDRTQIPFLYCYLEDYNKWSSNVFLGDFECDISSILEKPNAWGIEKEFALNNLKKTKCPDDPTGVVFLKIGFLEKGKENMELAI